MNEERHKNLQLLQTIQEHFCEEQYLFQHDGALLHKGIQK